MTAPTLAATMTAPTPASAMNAPMPTARCPLPPEAAVHDRDGEQHE
jgi:hypothetical protein